jgi:hypothetical protein
VGRRHDPSDRTRAGPESSTPSPSWTTPPARRGRTAGGRAAARGRAARSSTARGRSAPSRSPRPHRSRWPRLVELRPEPRPQVTSRLLVKEHHAAGSRRTVPSQTSPHGTGALSSPHHHPVRCTNLRAVPIPRRRSDAQP